MYHPDVEGLHVRYGPVARGGLRWSDRVEDYRDEVIALAKAQQVKNSLIVPSGAKGAFVVKASMAGLSRAAAAAQVRRSYRIFVRGLLDVTDNVTLARRCPSARRRRRGRSRPLSCGGRGQGHRGLLGPGERGGRRRRATGWATRSLRAGPAASTTSSSE